MSSHSILSKTRLAVLASSLLLAGLGVALAADVQVTLSGDQEVPPVTTSAKGEGVITVTDDMKVSGQLTTTGIDSTVAHIHEAAPGKNGPPIIPLLKKGDNEWTVPDNSTLTDAQYQSYKAGDLYVNVHSDAYKDGEIRGQIKP